DPLTIDVTIRDGARFSDGTAVTATDVVRTFETECDPRCGATSQKEFAERFDSFEARSDKVVRFHLKRTLGTFVTDIDLGIISFHGVPAGECDPPSVIGAGPYAVRNLNSRAAYLDANEFYPTPAKLPHVEIRFVKDSAARIL